MKHFIFLFFAWVFLMTSGAVFAQRSDSIAAVVNGGVITYTDLYDRMDLVIKSARMPNTKEFKAKLLPQVLTGLITEQVQLQEAERLGLVTAKAEIDQGFAELAAQNKLKPEQFASILKQQKINISTLQTQIESQLAWGKVIQSEIRPRVSLSDDDIDQEVARLKSREGDVEYFLAEIFMPFDDTNKESDVRKAATDLSKQLQKNIKKFPAAARQFSQSTTAANGGIIGWVTADQVNPDLAMAIKNLDVKKVSAPIKQDDGYSLLFIRDKRVIRLSDKKVKEKLRIKVASFPLPQDEVERSVIKADIENFMRDVKGCLDIHKQVTKNKQASLQEFYDTPVHIPDAIRDAVEGVNIGNLGEKIESDTKILIPMLCGREGGSQDAALEREVEGRLGTQKIDILQKRYLRDLIAEAYIERRL